MIHLYTKDYIVESEIINIINSEKSKISGIRNYLNDAFFKMIKRHISEYSIPVGTSSVRVVDRRVLPYETRTAIYGYTLKNNFTDLRNTVSVSTFMEIAGLKEKRFLPDDMIVVSISNKRTGATPVIVKLPDDFISEIKRGKTFYYLGYRNKSVKYHMTDGDFYFDKIITTYNPDTERVFYFGVW